MKEREDYDSRPDVSADEDIFREIIFETFTFKFSCDPIQLSLLEINVGALETSST